MSTKIIREYYRCDASEQAHWRDAIAQSDWKAGQKLYELLSADTLRITEWIGADARLYLLTEDDQLCAFCTLSANDCVPDTDLTPWIGFVYTFPAWRGQHLFGVLLAHAIEQARMDGHTAVCISTDYNGLYEKYGAAFLEHNKDLWGAKTRIYRLDFGWMQADDSERGAGLPCREKAERILEESHLFNPGPWREHSYCVAHAAERIANACGDIDPERAYLCGLLHDIGRRFGKGHLRHVYDGWQFMERLGFPGIARVCLTHSFKLQKLDEYIGNHDLSGKEEEAVRDALSACHYDDIDLLIQLCDTICGTQVMNIEERMLDVKRRYGGHYPQDKWNANLEILRMFEDRVGGDIYQIAEGQGAKNIHGELV